MVPFTVVAGVREHLMRCSLSEMWAYAKLRIGRAQLLFLA